MKCAEGEDAKEHGRVEKDMMERNKVTKNMMVSDSIV